MLSRSLLGYLCSGAFAQAHTGDLSNLPSMYVADRSYTVKMRPWFHLQTVKNLESKLRFNPVFTGQKTRAQRKERDLINV